MTNISMEESRMDEGAEGDEFKSSTVPGNAW